MMTAGRPSTQEQPLPSAQPQRAVERQQRFGDRRADDHRHGNGHHEQGAGPRAMRRRHPVGEIEDDAREEPRLGDAQQHAEQVEAPHAADQHHRHRDDAPADHDACDPEPRADALEDQVARHLEQAVAKEEQARAQAERGVGQPEVALQLGGGKPDVHAIDVGDDVAEEDEGDQARGDAPHRGLLERVRRGRHRAGRTLP